VDNSSLTGESEPVPRTVSTTEENPLEASNLLFMGTLCVDGDGVAVVIKTGDDTLIGRTAKLATASNKESEYTILQREIRSFVQKASVIAIIVGTEILTYIF
jgi:sodium/potassium-transporting ATPase subunit alpha